MKKTSKVDKRLAFLALARVYLCLFALSLIAIVVVKILNASEMGALKADFFWAITGFSFILSTPVEWGSTSVDVIANICTVSVLSILLFGSLISYILYYKNLATVKCDKVSVKVDCKAECACECEKSCEKSCEDKVCEKSCDNKSCENKEKLEMMILETPIVDERVTVKSSDLMTFTYEEVEQVKVEEPVVKEEKPKANAKSSKKVAENVKDKEIKVVVAPVIVAETKVKAQPKAKKDTKKRYPQVHKGELLEELYASEELKEMTKVDIKTVFEKTFIVFGKHLVSEGEVLVYKFGKFELVDVKARESINPRTKEKITVPAHKTAKFKISKSLKEQMNK